MAKQLKTQCGKMSNWWSKMLEEYRQAGKRDADKGMFDSPDFLTGEDPEYHDEAWAYETGWWERVGELGKNFKFHDG